MKFTRRLKFIVSRHRAEQQSDSRANLLDYIRPDEHVQIMWPVSTGGRIRFFGYVALTEQRLLLVLSEHPRKRRPFEMLGGVSEHALPVTVRRSWRLDGRMYGFVAIRTAGRTLWLQPWGEPLRPLADFLRHGVH